MFAEYLKDEEGCETYFTDYGFVSYTFNSETLEFFCHHIFVKKSDRGKGIDFGVEIENKAREMGARTMTGNVWFNAINNNQFIKKLRIFEGFGFEVQSVQANVVTVLKELKE
jgi:hypothetical protein